MKKPKRTTEVSSHKHSDKRRNIPTEETRRFMAEEQLAEKNVLYPRDPSLDPQLVWRGKDELDAQDLEVPSIPIYIQEKIHPQAIIEDFKRSVKKEKTEPELNLFSDFNGIKFEDMIDFYHHEQNWSNRMILGDSLLVMNSLAERESLKGKVQMIYIDPPYGIKFGSNWQVSTRKRDVRDGKVEDLTRQPEQVKAFRDTWQLGIHSYLTYLRDRLQVARELLTESGSVFVQIGDENVHLVRSLMDEVIGSENFISSIGFKTSPGATTDYLPPCFDYILWYAKDRSSCQFRKLFLDKEIGIAQGSSFDMVQRSDGEISKVSEETVTLAKNKDFDGRFFRWADPRRKGASEAAMFDFAWFGHKYKLANNMTWKTTKEGLVRLGYANRLGKRGKQLNYKRFLDDFPVTELLNIWNDTMNSFYKRNYVVETMHSVIQRCLLMTTDPGDLVLDPTCGSGTTSYVAEQWGRRWITIDTSRVALALARTRLMAAKYPYYHLADSQEGIQKESVLTGQTPPDYPTHNDIKKGFVYKRVPHITLKSIANNTEIDTIYDNWQEQMEPVRKKLNKALKESWEDWQIPREVDKKWSDEVKKLHESWWQMRRDRQSEIDASIARNADTEVLYDQPYEDNKRLRVTGPFTMESLSPHRKLSVTDKLDQKEGYDSGAGVVKLEAHGPDTFGQMILDNMRKAGVQNMYKGERLKFDRLESYAGEWIHGEGEYTEKGGKVKRVAVCVGPEHGTVGPDLIREAAKEAVKGDAFDTLIVTGFALDPMVEEETRHYGRLTILIAKMNPDLAMGDELLKKTGSGNLFMIFGEPDVGIQHVHDDQLQVEIKGLDVYDPTTGQVRSSSTDDIACWFIDTEYNEESFFVRHAYFTGADKPYERLQKALKAEINEDAWSEIYSTVSRPFPKPEKGRIAVKVINHYGDEVVKVYEI